MVKTASVGKYVQNFFINEQLLVILALLNVLIVTLNIPQACKRDALR